MEAQDPLQKSKDQFSHIISKISNSDSAVGIDVQLTHAIIIDSLLNLHKRIDSLEKEVQKLQAP